MPRTQTRDETAREDRSVEAASGRNRASHARSRTRPGTRETDGGPSLAGALQRSFGNRAVTRLVRGGLRLTDPGDATEREATRMVRSLADAAPATTHREVAGPGANSPADRRGETRPVGLRPQRRPEMSGGLPLPDTVRSETERLFDRDFGRVRVHTGPDATAAARALDARAFTVGQDVFFDSDEFRPETDRGRGLVAHELAHTVQRTAGPGASTTVRRQAHGEPQVSVRSPVAEETFTQASAVAGAVGGRSLTAAEVSLARSVFGSSIDFGRIRLVPMPTSVLQYRTVGNVVYVPTEFDVSSQTAAETFVHELTHVWQYQHGGTRYISVSLSRQIWAAFSSGSRNAAYDYQIDSDDSFFDFTPEQQGLVVQNYFAMLRDRAAIRQNPSGGAGYRSNHMTAGGNWRALSASDRLAEITRELPQHERLVRQMRAAMPRAEVNLLQQRASEVTPAPGTRFGAEQVPEERRLTPLKPVLEVRF